MSLFYIGFCVHPACLSCLPFRRQVFHQHQLREKKYQLKKKGRRAPLQLARLVFFITNRKKKEQQERAGERKLHPTYKFPIQSPHLPVCYYGVLFQRRLLYSAKRIVCFVVVFHAGRVCRLLAYCVVIGRVAVVASSASLRVCRRPPPRVRR